MKLCPYCGAALPIATAATSAKCRQCGNAFNTAPASTPAPAPEEPTETRETDDRAADRLMAEGEKLMAARKFRGAVMKFRAASGKSPDRPDILRRLAEACSKSDMVYEALCAHLTILKIDPDNKGALFKTGILFTQQKRHNQAIAALGRLREIDPANAQAELMFNIAQDNLRKEREGADGGQGDGGGGAREEWQIRLITLLKPSAGQVIYTLGVWLVPLVIFAAVYGYTGPDGAVYTQKILAGAMMLYAVSISVAIHELGHGAAAYLQGDDTAMKAQRLTLNPLKHISAIGTILAPIVTYVLSGIMLGWGKPMPRNQLGLARWPHGQAAVAIAGPLANFVLAQLAYTLFLALATMYNGAGVESTLFYMPEPGKLLDIDMNVFAAPAWFALMEITAMVAGASLVIGVFNLLPFSPLDGGFLLSLVAPARLGMMIRRGFILGPLVISLAVCFGWVGWLVYPALMGAAFYKYLAGVIL